METLRRAATNGPVVVDGEDFLDFTLDDEQQNPKAAKTTAYDRALTRNGSHLDCVEEELEWLSNKEAFPSVESCFGILADNLELVVNHQSPVSVLENSSSSSNNSNTNSNGSTVASCCENIKVPTNYPVRARSRGQRRKRRATGFAELLGQQCLWMNLVNTKEKQESSFLFPPVRAVAASNGAGMGRRCLHCQADKTPQWRAGPMGPKTLCNACGVRYKSGRLLPEYRPANSPTFSSTLHSNSHRKVVEMRRQKHVGTGGGVVAYEGCGYRVGG